MSVFQRVLSFFGSQKQPEPKSQFDNATAEELLSMAERLMLESVRSYKPKISDRSSRFAQAEYAPFMFFWVQHWHDQQPKPIREYDVILKILMAKSQDGSHAIQSYYSLNFHKGWDLDLWFEDRLRIYRSIIATESQKSSGAGPPTIFTASHMLATLSARSNSLDVRPDVVRSTDLLDLCLSKRIYPDALEQFNLYNQATTSLATTIPLLIEVITEMHLRRLANLAS